MLSLLDWKSAFVGLDLLCRTESSADAGIMVGVRPYRSARGADHTSSELYDRIAENFASRVIGAKFYPGLDLKKGVDVTRLETLLPEIKGLLELDKRFNLPTEEL